MNTYRGGGGYREHNCTLPPWAWPRLAVAGGGGTLIHSLTLDGEYKQLYKQCLIELNQKTYKQKKGFGRLFPFSLAQVVDVVDARANPEPVR